MESNALNTLIEGNILDNIVSLTHRNSMWHVVQVIFYISIILLAGVIIWLLIVKVIPTLLKVLPLVNDVLKAEECDYGLNDPPKTNVGKIVADIACYDENKKKGMKKPYTSVGKTFSTVLDIVDKVDWIIEKIEHPWHTGPPPKS